MKNILPVIGALLILFAISRFFDATHTTKDIPPNRHLPGLSAESSEALKSLTCIIQMDTALKESGTRIPDIGFPDGSFTPITPLGTMVYRTIPLVAGQFFENVMVKRIDDSPAEGDVVIKVRGCTVLQGLEDTTWRIRGLQMVGGRVDMVASVELDLDISGDRVSHTLRGTMKTKGRSTGIGEVRAFPVPQFRTMMTGQLESAVQKACIDTFKQLADALTE